MRLKSARNLIIALMVVVAGYGGWRRMADPPRVVATGMFQMTDRNGATLLFPKRSVAVAGFETIEVQLPLGTWIDCRGDCAAAVRAEYSEFWDNQMIRTR